MGSDKALLVVDGKTLLHRAAQTCLLARLPVIIVGREKPAGWTLTEALFVPDDKPDQGPLAGIATALRQVDGAVAAMACDMPNLTVEALQWLVEEFRKNSSEHGVVVTGEKGMEPLFSVYASAARKHIESVLAAGERSCHRCIKSGKFAQIAIPEHLTTKLANVNTREDLKNYGG
jgi:molybdopterin-guanine dinucleotide biosynthesis protein A